MSVLTENRGKRNTYSRLGIPLIAVFITSLQIIFLIWRFSSWFYDDPFITFRYAWNFLHSSGFFYNQGERVLSTTTPFFTVLLAGIGVFWSDLPHVATFIGCLSAGLSGLVFWDLAREWKMNFAGWVGLLLIPTFPLIDSTISSEIPFYIFLVLASLNCFVKEKYKLTAIFTALLIMVRPDGVILPILLAFVFLVGRKKHIPWAAIGIFSALSVIWFGGIWLYFGSPIPSTLLTKQQQAIMAISQQFPMVILKIAKPYAQKWGYILEASLAIIGIFWIVIYRQPSMLLVIWTFLYFLAYTLLKVTGYFWYYAPLIPGLIIMVGAGLQWLFELFSPIRLRGLRTLRLERFLFLLLAFLLIYQVIDTYRYSLTPDKKFLQYRAIGLWLKENTKPIEKVGMLEIGIIGYYADRPVVDFAGLIQPEVSQHMLQTSTYEDTGLWALTKYNPSYVVINREGFINLKWQYLDRYCQIVQYFYKQPYGAYSDMVIYHCPGTIN